MNLVVAIEINWFKLFGRKKSATRLRVLPSILKWFGSRVRECRISIGTSVEMAPSSLTSYYHMIALELEVRRGIARH